MSKLARLWGGPLDGRVMAVQDHVEYIRIPMALHPVHAMLEELELHPASPIPMVEGEYREDPDSLRWTWREEWVK